MRGKLVVIVGPTGVGKTELSLQLAQRWGCPIVNCDSRQIYRDLPIGTAAPTQAEQALVKHYFVGTHALDETYNAGKYERDCVALLNELDQQHNRPTPFAILTGGSMLYIDAVCKGLDDIPETPERIRKQVADNYKEKGLEWLQEEVKKVDPTYWEEADRQNPQRLMHCLEVSLGSGRAYSAFRKKQQVERPWDIIKIAVTRDRETLYERINKRVDKMIEEGMEQEARAAYEQMKNAEELPNSLNTVGYRELIRDFKGEWSKEEAIRMIKQNSRHYAKRQLTWFRAQDNIHWVDINQPIETIIKEIEKEV